MDGDTRDVTTERKSHVENRPRIGSSENPEEKPLEATKPADTTTLNF